MPHYPNPKAIRRRATGYVVREKRLGDSGADEPIMMNDVHFDDVQRHDLITSMARGDEPTSGPEGLHFPCFDIDAPCRVVPSATPGHFHLYVDVGAKWDSVVEFLDAGQRIGLFEPGYVAACKRRGFTATFAPEF